MGIFYEFFNAFYKFGNHRIGKFVEKMFHPGGMGEYAFNIYIVLGAFVVGLILIAFCRSYFIQASRACFKDCAGIIKNGVIGYTLLVGLMLLFFASYLGCIISGFLMIFLFAFAIIGQVALAAALGSAITKGKNLYLDFITGYVLIEVLKVVPYINWIVSAIIVPMLAIGVVIQSVSNLFFYRKYYDSEYEKRKVTLDKSEIYDIIIHSDNREES